MEMWGKRNEGTRAGGHVRRQRGLVMGRGQSMGRRKGWEKQRERDALRRLAFLDRVDETEGE